MLRVDFSEIWEVDAVDYEQEKSRLIFISVQEHVLDIVDIVNSHSRYF